MVETGNTNASAFDQLLYYLGEMTPQQRQQVGMMHQNDFAVMSALSIINSQQQQARQAMMAQQAAGQPARPPVNQQVIAETNPQPLPEEVGIGALPAPNLETMSAAVGGIVGTDEDYDMGVGYAEGGVVERYQSGGLTAVAERLRQAEQQLAAAQRSRDDRSISFYTEQVDALRRELAETAASLNRTTTAPVEGPRSVREAASKTPTVPAVPAVPTTPTLPVTAAPATTAAPAATAAAPAGPRPAQPAQTAPVAAKPAAPADMTPEQFAKMYGQAESAVKAEDPAAKERAALQQQIVDAAKERKAEFEKEVAARGDRFKTREERLSKREAGLTKEAATNEGLALLSAAAAVLEPGGLAAGLGKAAKVAIPQYQAGLEKLRAAQERIEEGRDRLDELRQNYDDLTSKERRQLTDGVNTAAIEARRLGIEGIMTAQGVKEKKAASIYDSMIKQMLEREQQAGADRRARMQAGQEPAELRMLRALQADPKLMEAYLKTRPATSGINSLLAKYADPVELEMLKKTDPPLYEMVRAAMQRQLIPAPVGAPAGGAVRP